MADRRTPFVDTGERDMLIAFADYLREVMLLKTSGLDGATGR